MLRYVLLTLLAGTSSQAWAQNPAPVLLSASANGAIETTLHPGWPLLVRIDAMHAALGDTAVTPVLVSAPSGPWSEALHLTVTDASGAEQTWPLQPGGEQWFGVVLTGEAVANAAYWMDGAATAQLAPGTYTLTVRLDASAIEGHAASPDPKSVPVRITVVTGAESEAEARERALLEADLAVLRGEEARARTLIEAWLAGHPDDSGALAYRADLLNAAGAHADAEAAFEVALRAYRRHNPDLPEPLAALEWARNAAEAAHMNDITVTYGAKGPNHPYRLRGGTEGFALEGISGAEWLLIPDETYTFRLLGLLETQAFGLFRDPEAQTPYTQGVEQTIDEGDAVLRFSPDETTPEVLYYGSAGTPFAGGVLRLDRPVATPTPVSPETPVPAKAQLVGPFPNPAPARAVFTLSLPATGRVLAEAFDLQGRRVAYLLDQQIATGTYTFPLETASLARGTYVVRVVANGERFSRLVVVP